MIASFFGKAHRIHMEERMRSESYLVRMRGRVAGPYNMADLQKMVRRGTLSRIHEICADGINWIPASNIDGLFPPQPTSVIPVGQDQPSSLTDRPFISGPQEEGSLSPGTPMEDDGDLIPHHLSSNRYFYRRCGTVTGPVSLLALRDLASNGTLGPDDWVLEEGDDTWVLAHLAEPLSLVYVMDGTNSRSVSGRSAALASPTPMLSRPSGAASILQRTSSLNLAGGLSAAGLLLFCLNVPHNKNESGLVWWWDLLTQSGMGTQVLACIYVLLASICLLFVAPLLKGPSRAWPYLGCGILGLILLIVAVIIGDRIPFGHVLAMLAPVFGATVVCTSFFRRLAPESECGRMTQAVTGGLMGIATIAAALGGGFALARLRLENATVSQGVLLALILSVLGHLCGLAGGTLGLVTVRTAFSKPLNMTTIILGMVATVVPGITILIVGYVVASASAASSPEARFIFVQTLRVLVISYVFICLSAMGLFELLVYADSRLCEDR